MIEPGTPAPDFTLLDQDGRRVSLADFRGESVVLVFFPAAFSPVCTDQLNVYEEVREELAARDCRIVGVSVDGVFSLKAFQRQLGVEIPLLSDFHPKGEVCRAYGTYIEERGHSSRSLVLVGPDGVVRWAYESPPLEVPGANLIFDALEDDQAAA